MVATKQALLAVALILSTALQVSSLRAEEPYATIGSWTIRSAPVNNAVGCYAIGGYKDQTLLQMVLIKSATGKQWFLGIYHPAWKWASTPNSQHTLIIQTTGIWRGAFSVDNGWLWTTATVPFMNSIADAYWMKVYRENGRWLNTLSMEHTEDAIRTVVRCVNRQTPGPPEQPPPQPVTVSGTGFFVAANTILTANHVVSECQQGTIQVRDLDVNYWFGAMIAAQDRVNDLATLDTDRNTGARALFRLRPPEQGEGVATYGFPYVGDLSTKGNFTLGYITALQGPGDDNGVLQISAQVQPGSSGGPLFVLARMSMQPEGAPEDVNFARRASIAVNFLSASSISPELAPSTRSNLSSEKLAKETQKIAVHVICQATPKVASNDSGPAVAAVAAIGGKFSENTSSHLGVPLGEVKHQRNRSLLSKAHWQQL